MYSDISEEWKEECEHIKQMSEPLDCKQFGLQRLNRCLVSEFKVVQYMTQTERHLKKFYTDPGHFSYNRHPGILTFDKNRVTLGTEAEKDLPENYINANLIEISEHKCIATQGPLHSTINNFWKMIEEYKVSAIFMLCERIQKTKVKCDLYWPTNQDTPLRTSKEEDAPNPQYQYEIRFLGTEEQKHLKKRKFRLINLETQEIRQVVQYQIIGWPDGDKPDPKIEKCLSKVLQVMVHHLENDEMTVVHCSAGVGRTGTFIAMSQIKMMIQKVEKISVFECVRKLREQRWSMVYSASQYEYLYDFTEREANRFFAPNQHMSEGSEDETD